MEKHILNSKYSRFQRFLTMMYNTRNYHVFGLRPSSGILKKIENTTFQKLDLFPSSGYPQGFTDSVINSKGRSRPNKQQKLLGSVYIPYVKGVSEMFKHIGNRHNIRRIFKPKHIASLMKTRPERDPQQAAQCVYSIPCEFGRSYIGETGRPLAVRLREHKYNLKYGLLKKIKISPTYL
jgi:hypothetical protein